MENEQRIEQLTAEGIDTDIAEEIAGMSPEQLTAELSKVEANLADKETEARIMELSKPSPYLTTTQADFLTELIKAGADVTKASEFVSNKDCHDLNAREVILGQKLFSDAVIKEEADKQLRNEYLNSVITNNPELPLRLIEELYRCKDKKTAIAMLKRFGEEQVGKRIDKANAYILRESQAFDLPMELRAKIAGIRAKDLQDAERQVTSLIANFQRR